MHVGVWGERYESIIADVCIFPDTTDGFQSEEMTPAISYKESWPSSTSENSECPEFVVETTTKVRRPAQLDFPAPISCYRRASGIEDTTALRVRS